MTEFSKAPINPSQASGGDDGSRSKQTKKKYHRGKPSSDFKDFTEEIEGHVFQTFIESENKSQFKKVKK